METTGRISVEIEDLTKRNDEKIAKLETNLNEKFNEIKELLEKLQKWLVRFHTTVIQIN